MSYKSDWLSTLASLNANIKNYMANPSNKSSKTLQQSIDNFTTFVSGHEALLNKEPYNIEVIKTFNQTLTSQGSSNQLSDNEWLSRIQKFSNTLEEAILNIKEDSNMSIKIGNITGGNQQLGNHNTQNNNDINIDLKTLINQIEKSEDKEAKSKLRELLNNSTVASIIGASIPTIMQLLS